MKTKFELKMKMKQLNRQKGDVKFREQEFYSKQKLWQLCCKVGKGSKNNESAKKLFHLMENARNAWWKSIDKKLELEQEIKILEKKLIAEIMEEVK